MSSLFLRFFDRYTDLIEYKSNTLYGEDHDLWH